MPAGIWWRSSARTGPASCASTSPTAKPGARSAWASARASWPSARGKNPLFFGVLATVSQGRLVPVPGGVLIKDADGAVLGAVGISGDTSDKDEVCAVAGIEAAGLKAVVGA